MEPKTVIITGGNAGLGYQCAKNIAERDPGYHVVLACRSLPRADAAAETLTRDTSITVNAFNPGAMSDTGFVRPAGNVLVRGAVRVVGSLMGALVGKQTTSIESGAALASLVTEPSFATTTGKYLDRGVEVESSPLSHDERNARDLWETSVELSGLRQEETMFTSDTKSK